LNRYEFSIEKPLMFRGFFVINWFGSCRVRRLPIMVVDQMLPDPDKRGTRPLNAETLTQVRASGQAGHMSFAPNE
jgi:hypothetical protein